MTSHSDESTFRRRLYFSIMLRSKGFAPYFKIRTLFYCSKWWTMNFWYQRKYRFSLEKIFFYLCSDQDVVPLIELIIRHLLSITLSPCPRVVFVLCEEWGEAGERWGPGLAMCSVCLSPPDAPHTSHSSHLTSHTSHLTYLLQLVDFKIDIIYFTNHSTCFMDVSPVLSGFHYFYGPLCFECVTVPDNVSVINIYYLYSPTHKPTI